MNITLRESYNNCRYLRWQDAEDFLIRNGFNQVETRDTCLSVYDGEQFKSTPGVVYSKQDTTLVALLRDEKEEPFSLYSCMLCDDLGQTVDIDVIEIAPGKKRRKESFKRTIAYDGKYSPTKEEIPPETSQTETVRIRVRKRTLL
jgi:hypothetical protein